MISKCYDYSSNPNENWTKQRKSDDEDDDAYKKNILLTRHHKISNKISLNCVKIVELWISNLLFNFVKMFYKSIELWLK